MNRDEDLARRYLERLGIGRVEYEPDGNVPPDFVVDERIAVEVTRMSQRVEDRGQSRGLEELEIPLRERIVATLADCGPRLGERSWFVLYDFARPAPDWPILRAKLKNWLLDFRVKPHAEVHRVSLIENFSISLHPSSEPLEQHFELGGYTDGDAGGWVLSLFEENLRHCMQHKARKVSQARLRYTEWWLVLVDQVTFGLSERDRAKICATERSSLGWDRVVVLFPQDEDRPFIVPSDG